METQILKVEIGSIENEILNMLHKFMNETGFRITDIDLRFIENSSRCGKAYTLSGVSLKISR